MTDTADPVAALAEALHPIFTGCRHDDPLDIRGPWCVGAAARVLDALRADPAAARAVAGALLTPEMLAEAIARHIGFGSQGSIGDYPGEPDEWDRKVAAAILRSLQGDTDAR